NGNGTATLSGTPAAGTGGNYSFTITASNGVSPAATQSFALTVQEAPAITSANNAAFTSAAGFQYGAQSFTITTNGFPRPTITIPARSLPFGLSFTDNGN